MQVVGAGLSRTGTMSTHAALERLGFPCYHMTEVARASGHLEAWASYLSESASMDWSTLFQNYEATVDTPSCLFYREIMEAFPRAKVLLNLRDPAKWYESLVTLASTLEEFRPMAMESKRLGQFLSVTDAVGRILSAGDFSRENCVRKFNEHNDAVRESVPSDRLLVFRVEDGWEPLCEFLDRPVPAEPFPYLNEGRSTIQDFVRQVLL